MTFELSVPPCYERLAFCFSSYASERCLIQEESINFHRVKYVWQLSIAYIFVYTALVFLIPASHYPHRKLQDVCLSSLRVPMLQTKTPTEWSCLVLLLALVCLSKGRSSTCLGFSFCRLKQLLVFQEFYSSPLKVA